MSVTGAAAEYPADLSVRIDRIGSGDADAIAWIADRMRETLVEVLGRERGESMYESEWLVDRVRSHVDPQRIIGAVARAMRGDMPCGHVIVREQDEAELGRVGVFATMWVEPDARRAGIARALLAFGEGWMREHGLALAMTYTDADNVKLQRLYLDHGYSIEPMPADFVRLRRVLSPAVD